ncbi:hypothetical protein A2X44_01515 [candidate division CPR3 bacterium GWF2_35_18]|uniref:Uncharacterized protein n=1 Tax=candidate division CPR3 bacterium GW2011_GWF2_35_18 TaxID=1618350 RepID=A0A0G0ESU4_UNCC3|nr:MAG: hypothetical protein UR67_C0001G0281 [candidate division CPR3 bacterium GW2011_GWF2_35_18]KKP86474.1 MAG: hypothetical protein UR87_C0018G0003 [candidate division CPR3 bacterium GW2011_GWE2_35_7]OGB63581.1 MAG: hypothetical protein A2X44_01515 [candidate division CPR3 bacterium GWF2_35_18]OGB64690.1 MAG: hypothetical protein A2250_04065 [candidate division CPR3 bacterium RIFOXYA2_FULL_35_13]OGB77171.1 MAG: hypothetical protein A2476_00870 [candidate division CPR3 bacterium RIFOXYC2_FULL
MFTAKKKLVLKKAIKTKSPTLQFIINYERIFLFIGPIAVFIIILLIVLFIENNDFSKFFNFFKYKGWTPPSKTETTTSYQDDSDIVIENPPALPDIDENKPLSEILTDIEKTMVEMSNDDFTSELIQKIHDEALTEMNSGNEVIAKEKLIFGYKLAQEMYFAYQNKQIRFRESTMSGQ